MSHRVVFDVDAERDLDKQLEYLVENAGEVAAHRFIDRIVDYCLGFETFPERGTRRDDISPGLRTVGYRRKATIAFRVKGDTVTIARVLFRGQEFENSDADDAV